MIPDKNKIQINTNEELIKQFISEIIIQPRTTLRKWSEITHQTPAIKLGYVGQHLASLITGVKGTASGARGDDLEDHSEVKSCNKVDQSDKCQSCGKRVLRYEEECPYCHSTNIKRNNDSKWLFSVRDDNELRQYLQMDRIVLLLMDYPNFENNDFNDMRISAFEIYPKEERMKNFRSLIENHYYNIYLPKRNDNVKTNPMNLYPLQFQFYMCNPVQVFECIVSNINSASQATINVTKFVSPTQERGENISSPNMPSNLLEVTEWEQLLDRADYDTEIRPLLTQEKSKTEFLRLSKKDKCSVFPQIPETLRKYIDMREIVSVRQTNRYSRN